LRPQKDRTLFDGRCRMSGREPEASPSRTNSTDSIGMVVPGVTLLFELISAISTFSTLHFKRRTLDGAFLGNFSFVRVESNSTSISFPSHSESFEAISTPLIRALISRPDRPVNP